MGVVGVVRVVHMLTSLSVAASIVLEVPLEKKVSLGYHSPVRAGVAEW